MLPCIRARAGDPACARRAAPGARGLVVGLVLAALWLALPALAQQDAGEMDDILRGIGSATRADDDTSPPGQKAGEGTIRGRVFDGAQGTPIQGVTVIAIWPTPADGSEPRQEVTISDADGGFEFPSIPPGSYRLSFVKSGYRTSAMTDFAVQPGVVNRADFPLPPLPTGASDQVLDLDAFVVEASTVDDMMAALELRMDSDVQINVMSAEDLSRYAATDVADALKRVAGVNIVEGQFAIIRGLEDRYSGTLYNHAPVPSPDPDRQSVQLDLFPAEIVEDLVIAKTFSAELPSNSSGGALDVITHDYPSEEFTFKLKSAGSFNENAWRRSDELVSLSPVGKDGDGVLGSEWGAFFGGRREIAGRELRVKGIFNWELDFETAVGFKEEREPRRPLFRQEGRPTEQVLTSGSLGFGQLDLTKGRYDYTLSERSEQLTGYGGLGLDLDEDGEHKLDFSIFYTRKEQEEVEANEDGTLRGFDYAAAAGEADAFGVISNPDFFITNGASCSVCATNDSWLGRTREAGDFNKGPLYFANFQEDKSFDTTRDLLVVQLNGDHRFEWLDDLHLSWAGNHARTGQSEQALRARIFYEPESVPDPLPTDGPRGAGELGTGFYVAGQGILASENEIDETQWFGRIDADYEADLAEKLALRFATGGWYETADRDVLAYFSEPGSINVGSSTQFGIPGESPLAIGKTIFAEIDPLPFKGIYIRENESAASREIWAFHFGSKATIWDRFDLLGGLRYENIFIESLNDPITTDERFGAPATFPEMYILFDRLDNPARGEVTSPRTGVVYNDQILGIDVPVDPETGFVDFLDEAAIQSVVNGTIEERKLLPHAGFAVRPLEGLTWRGAWSQTVARPSFREMGFYATVEPGKDDLVLGNPQLELSEVTSWDTRVEYVYGGRGDLVAVSGFYKTIENPIESILIGDPIDLTGTVWKTFFNNPNEAMLWGIEAEARKYLDFVGVSFLENFSLGGNFTYIRAEVDRTQAELDRAAIFFRTTPAEMATYRGLEKSRRLFGQPEWIANADLSFDHPDWGTKATLAVFAISDVLDAAGTARLGPDGRVLSLTLDRYLDAFYQLDLVLSQSWAPSFLRGGELTLSLSAKNLTDSYRGITYDRAQTDATYRERRYRVGRDFKLGLAVSF